MPRLTKAKQKAATAKRLETLAIKRATNQQGFNQASQPVDRAAVEDELRDSLTLARKKLALIRMVLEI